MSEYLIPLTNAFARHPVGSAVVGRDRRGDLQHGYVAPGGFGVITQLGAVNFGRAWVTAVRDAPVNGVFNTDPKFTWKLWADTLVAADEFKPEPEPSAVVAHLLVEVTFRPGEANDAEALRLADTLVDKTLNMAKQVDRYYIRQLGTARVND